MYISIRAIKFCAPKLSIRSIKLCAQKLSIRAIKFCALELVKPSGHKAPIYYPKKKAIYRKMIVGPFVGETTAV